MSSPLRRFRGLAIALAVLAITAGVAFAGGAPHFAPSTAPVAQEEPVPTEVPEATEVPEPTEAPEGTETPETLDGESAGDTRGAMVSAAAQMETPQGFGNHGAFVSCVARLDEIVDPATVTAAMCAEADAARDAAKAERAAERAAAKAGRDAAKAERDAARAAARAERDAAKAERQAAQGRP